MKWYNDENTLTFCHRTFTLLLNESTNYPLLFLLAVPSTNEFASKYWKIQRNILWCFTRGALYWKISFWTGWPFCLLRSHFSIRGLLLQLSWQCWFVFVQFHHICFEMIIMNNLCRNTCVSQKQLKGVSPCKLFRDLNCAGKY